MVDVFVSDYESINTIQSVDSEPTYGVINILNQWTLYDSIFWLELNVLLKNSLNNF